MFRRRIIQVMGGLVGIGGLLGSAIPVAADTKSGEIKTINPPDNNGTDSGTGHIEEIVDGVGQGRPYFVFHTPDDNEGVPLPEGTKVRFNADGQRATNVELEEPLVQCSVSKTEVEPDEKVVIEASGDLQRVEFDVDGDGTYDRTNDTDFTEVVTYSEPGTYTPVIRAETLQQSVTEECPSIRVIKKQKLAEPIARCSLSKTEVEPDDQVVIDASESNADLVRFDVDGDGDFDRTNDTDFTEVVTYSEPGTYTPVIRAEILQRSDTEVCKTVTVIENQN